MDEKKRMSGRDQAGFPDHKRLTLLSLFEEEDLEKILWHLASATDLAVALADYRGDECTDCINYAEFCRFAREGDPPLCTAANATNAFGFTQAAVTKKPFIYFCPYNLLMFAIPIVVNGEYLGGFVGGQVRCEDAPEDTVHLKNVLPYKKDFLDDELTRKIWEETNLVSYEKFVNVAALMESYIYQLTEKRRDGILYDRLKAVERELESERDRRMEAEKKSSRYKMLSLRTQVRPYFIMRTLIAISNMAIIENAVQTNELITRFARLLTELFRKNSDIVTVEEELHMADSYLMIYQTWMDDKLDYRIEMDERVKRQKIPAMILFPLIEQIALYTVIDSGRQGRIRITAECRQDWVVIRIVDNRSVEDRNENSRMLLAQVEELQGNSFGQGIDLAKERMEEYFHRNYEFTVEAMEDGQTLSSLKYSRFFERERI